MIMGRERKDKLRVSFSFCKKKKKWYVSYIYFVRIIRKIKKKISWIKIESEPKFRKHMHIFARKKKKKYIYIYIYMI